MAERRTVRQRTTVSAGLLPPARPLGGAKGGAEYFNISGRRTIKSSAADGLLAKGEAANTLTPQQPGKIIQMKKDGTTQTIKSSKQQSPIVDLFCTLVVGIPFLDFHYFRDWLQVASRAEELEGVVSREEILAQFAFHFGNMLEHQSGREGQSLLSRIQDTEVDRRVQQIQHAMDEKYKQEQVENREKVRVEIAMALEQTKQATTMTSGKEMAAMRLEQALYNTTLRTLREELTQREERIACLVGEGESLKEEVRSLAEAFGALRQSREQAVAAAEQRSLAHTQDNEYQLSQMGTKMVDQGETLLRYHGQLQMMRRDFQAQTERLQAAHEGEILSLKGTNSTLQHELDRLHTKHVDLVKDHTKVTGKQTQLLATLAKNNLLMVERQHRPAKLRIRMGVTTEDGVSVEDRRPSTGQALRKLNAFQPIRDTLLQHD